MNKEKRKELEKELGIILDSDEDISDEMLEELNDGKGEYDEQ
ncbi:hypothetical protein [Senegalia massiliensis]|nr:hypothetical protein [Senegalia massiliensis]